MSMPPTKVPDMVQPILRINTKLFKQCLRFGINSAALVLSDHSPGIVHQIETILQGKRYSLVGIGLATTIKGHERRLRKHGRIL